MTDRPGWPELQRRAIAQRRPESSSHRRLTKENVKARLHPRFPADLTMASCRQHRTQAPSPFRLSPRTSGRPGRHSPAGRSLEGCPRLHHRPDDKSPTSAPGASRSVWRAWRRQEQADPGVGGSHRNAGRCPAPDGGSRHATGAGPDTRGRLRARCLGRWIVEPDQPGWDRRTGRARRLPGP